MPPTPTSDELLARYSYSSWSHLFPKSHLVPAIVVPLEEDFLDYLRSDGMQLPVECQEETSVVSPTSSSSRRSAHETRWRRRAS